MNAQLNERRELAVEVLRLAKDRLLVSSPFLAPAASLLPLFPPPMRFRRCRVLMRRFSTSTPTVCWLALPQRMKRPCMTTCIRCFIACSCTPSPTLGKTGHVGTWPDDIAAECVAVELCGPRPGDTSARRGVCSQAHLRRLAAGPADCGIGVQAAENRPFCGR